jgi:hypothetical protein
VAIPNIFYGWNSVFQGAHPNFKVAYLACNLLVSLLWWQNQLMGANSASQYSQWGAELATPAIIKSVIKSFEH